jgi:hypothetical protein
LQSDKSGQKIKEDACNLFQPLYGCSAEDSADTTEKQNIAKSLKNSKDPITLARGTGFESGFSAGEAEACQTVKKGLQPDLEALMTAFEDLAVYQSLVAETAAQCVFELAFLITERIMATPSSLEMQSLDRLKEEFEASLVQAYRVTLLFNPETLQNLQQALASNQIKWPEHPFISIQTDENQAINQVAGKAVNDDLDVKLSFNLADYLKPDARVSTS